MMKYICFLLTLIFLFSCNIQENKNQNNEVRNFVDTVGFAHTAEQTDSVLIRIKRLFSSELDFVNDSLGLNDSTVWKGAICPHDDHAYASYLYPALLQYVKAKYLIIFGVAHKAWKLGIKDSLVFGTYKYWKGAYGNIKISDLRNEIISKLPEKDYIVNDTMMAIEHSIEAFLPFLQKQNPNIEIIPILVPYMNFNRTDSISNDLSEAIFKVMSNHSLKWGEDFAIIISTDAVHYGDQNWGGDNLAPFGADSDGYQSAVRHEFEILKTLTDTLKREKIKAFFSYTVSDTNYMKYKWTWCGRYSVPMGMLTMYKLSKKYNISLKGILVGYATSIDHKTLPVEDLGMGVTAPANIRHWVGYAAVGFLPIK